MRRGSTTLILLFLTACGGDDGGPPVTPDAEEAPPDGPWAAPAVAITSHQDGQRITGSRDVTVAGVIDSWAPIDDVTVTVDGVPVDVTYDDASFSAAITLDDGTSTIAVTATSAAGDGSDTVDLVYPFVPLTTFQAAARVLGQPDFTTGAVPVEVTASTIPFPYGHVAWDGATLYVNSSDQNRVLGFVGFPAADNQAADFAIGQPDLTTADPGTGAAGMEYPQTIEVLGDRLYVLDWSGSRIMAWSTAPTTSGEPADFAIGQADLDSLVTGCAQEQTRYPDDFFIGAGKMIVSDSENHRVLVYNTIPTSSGALPDLVLGQSDFVHCTFNDDDQDGFTDGATARTLENPVGAWTDGTRLFIADSNNHRVLGWNTFPTTSFQPADFVLGQPDFTAESPATSATGMNRPKEVTSNGNQLVVGEQDNSRVLVWNTVPTAATPPDVVLGQGDFVHGAFNDDDQDGVSDAAPSARTFHGPDGVQFVGTALAVSDLSNHRILFFGELP